MSNANPNLIFFVYIAVIAVLCPLLEGLTKHFSRP